MIDDIKSETQDAMDRAIDALKKQLTTIRAGRANVGILDGVKVDYYGTPTPLNQVGNVSATDPTMIVVKPWEKNLLNDIERAINEANIGLNASNDGDIVRVPIPPLSEERRKEYAKQAKGRCEDAKVAIRNARRDANDLLKAATKDKEISEDDEKRGLKEVQDLTDAFVAKIDELYANKEAEILEV
jgi:ribosome recycling factor